MIQEESRSYGTLALADAGLALAQLGRYNEDLKMLVRERKQVRKELESAHLNALMLLCRAAEYRDDETSVHMDRVGHLSERMALLIGRSEEEAHQLRFAAPMHDIGKIGIPDAVLKKPGGYTIAERRIMNQHTILGAEILGQSDVPVFQMAAEVALTHHECWDGSGYPRQLSGEQIPWTGRVVALIDFFDALTMDRVYRKAFSDERALQMIQEERARKLDPALVDLFLRHADEFIGLRDEVNAAAEDYAARLRADAGELANLVGL
jgi:putative two-component system response regulator